MHYPTFGVKIVKTYTHGAPIYNYRPETIKKDGKGGGRINTKIITICLLFTPFDFLNIFRLDFLLEMRKSASCKFETPQLLNKVKIGFYSDEIRFREKSQKTFRAFVHAYNSFFSDRSITLLSFGIEGYSVGFNIWKDLIVTLHSQFNHISHINPFTAGC